MATTPDLPPGARFRMWALFTFTAVVGVAMYMVFERTEGLLVAGGVLLILLYLLMFDPLSNRLFICSQIDSTKSFD